MNTSIQMTQSLSSGAQAECRRINSIIIQHESIIPILSQEVQVSSQRVNSVISSVENKMRELEDRMNEIKESDKNSEIPPNIVSSLNDIIVEGAPSTIIEVIRQQVEELSQVVCTEEFITDDLMPPYSALERHLSYLLVILLFKPLIGK